MCILSICLVICIFCLALYGQYWHLNCGSLPHSHFWWFLNELFNLYALPHSGHIKRSPSDAVVGERLLLLFFVYVVVVLVVLFLFCNVNNGFAKYDAKLSKFNISSSSSSSSSATKYFYYHTNTGFFLFLLCRYIFKKTN